MRMICGVGAIAVACGEGSEDGLALERHARVDAVVCADRVSRCDVAGVAILFYGCVGFL